MITESPLSRDVVLFSTADWDNPFWTNKQHVARQLALRGFKVLYIESLGLRRPTIAPRDVTRILGRLRRAGQRPRAVEENLWVASPLAIPWHAQPWVRAVNGHALSRWLARQMRRLNFRRPIVWTYNPLVGALARQLGGSQLVYHCVDDLAAAPHMPAAAIRDGERTLAEAADLVFTTSPALYDRMVEINPQATHLLPNVADFDHFSRAQQPGRIPADLAAIPGPRIGFVGAVSRYKVDFELIAGAAKARPDWHWVLIGQVGEGEPGTDASILRLPNVHLLGPRPYAELPDYLRGFQVATIPAGANPYTAAMFPLKFFEYLAAGLPVVASHVPALANYASTCELVDSTGAFIAAVDRALAGQRSDPDYTLQVARRHTWTWRMDEMLAILERHCQARHAFGEAEPPRRLRRAG